MGPPQCQTELCQGWDRAEDAKAAPSCQGRWLCLESPGSQRVSRAPALLPPSVWTSGPKETVAGGMLRKLRPQEADNSHPHLLGPAPTL